MNVQRLDRHHATQTIALLEDLRVSFLGIHSRRLHDVLVNDGVEGTIDVRIVSDSDEVKGVVLAAPASYWRSLLLKHWGIAFDCIRAHAFARGTRRQPNAAARTAREALSIFQTGPSPRSWAAPGDAWRVIFVGTALDARGKGLAAQLYRSLMADRSLVARIAFDNTPSIRLHHAVGWRLYRDGDVALAIYLRESQASQAPSR